MKDKLIIKELYLKNFRSYSEHTFSNLNTYGLCLLLGDNGSGKSSIRQAIEYLLTDTTSDDLSLDEFSRKGKGDCCLRCVIDRDGDEVIITKYRDHKKEGNKTYLSINGNTETFTASDRRETQKTIESVLGIKPDTLSISTLFSKKSLSFPEAKEADRKDILYTALNLRKYEERRNKVKEKRDSIAKNIDQINYKLDTKKEVVEDIKDRGNSLVQQIKDFDTSKVTKLDSKVASKAILEQKLLVEEDTQPLLDKLDLYKSQITDLSTIDYEELERKLEVIREKTFSIATDIKYKKKRLEEVDIGKCYIFKDECERLQQRKEEVEKSLLPEIDKLSIQYEQLRKEEEIAKHRINTYRTKVNENENVEYKIQELETMIFKLSIKNESIKKEIDLINQQIENITQEENPYISLLEKEKEKFKIETSFMEDYVNQVKELSIDIKYYDFWLKGYSKSGIPNLKSEGFLDKLEIETNNILADIGSRLHVKIKSQTEQKKNTVEKISYKVQHPNKNIQDYKSYSEGQKQRVKIADLFAFHKLLGRFDFIALDEVLELSLDKKGKNSVIDLIKKLARDIGTVLVTSHDELIQDKFNSTISVKLLDGNTWVEHG